jgi:hypothetical protein
MAKTRRRALAVALAAAAAGLLLTLPSAAAAATKSIRFDARISANLLPITDGFQVDGVTVGPGEPTPIILTDVTTGDTTYAGTWVAYFADGSVHGLNRGTSSFSTSQSTFSEQLMVTGGTGRFSGAHGTLSGTGTIQTDSGVTAEHITGTLHVTSPLGRLPAPATQPRTHRFSAVARIEAAIPGNLETLAGPVTGLTPGGGALVIQVPASVPTATARLTYFDPSGTISGTAAITRTQHPHGSTSISGSGGFKSGTGRYRHLHVKPGNTFSGLRDPNNGLITIRLSGALVY